MIDCLKRTVHCFILDDDGVPLAWGRNVCDPPSGSCARMGVESKQEGYSGSGCNSVHAEVNAVKMLRDKGIHSMEVDTAVVIGHDFCCQPCLDQLRDAGVRKVTVLRSNGEQYEQIP